MRAKIRGFFEIRTDESGNKEVRSWKQEVKINREY
jgi:hypothetical protein